MAKIGRSPSYTIRNAHSYCFRMIVPQDIQQLIGKKELRYSLKTGYLSEAKSKSRLMAGKIQMIFQYLRKGHPKLKELSESKIQELIRSYFKKLIDDINDPISFDQVLEKGYIPPTNLKEYESLASDLDDMKTDLLVEMFGGYFSRVGIEDETLLKENRISGIDQDNPLYLKFCQGLLKAQIKGLDYEKKQMKGEFSDALGEGLRLQDEESNDHITLQQLMDRFISEKRKQE